VLLERDVTTTPQMLLRFVEGRPVSAVTIAFLDWACAQVQAQGIGVWVLVWDNAPWHRSKAVRSWIRQHNQQVKATGQGVRILPCFLPSQSPWLNPIEATWVHGKRVVAEFDRPLGLDEIEARMCAWYRCVATDHLIHPSLRKTEEVA
jgi:transposase